MPVGTVYAQGARMRFSKLASVLLLSSLMGPVSSLMTEQIASACGGCFVPPENNTIVTDHRMILAIGSNETTLYDQIRYQGSPESFAWVLPIRGEAKVGVSSDAVFAALDEISQVQVIAPPINCPSSGGGCMSSSSDFSSSPTAAENERVTVLRQETVGPYETVQLRSSDPGALNKWLSEKGYRITPEIEPVIASYVREKFDFLALKLVPGQSVRSMKPVRVSTPGASPVLPLRMVAAGAGASVGITLWTLGDGRWEPQNFPKFVVSEKDLIWNWAENASNFKALRAKQNTDLGGSAWEIESSIAISTSSLAGRVRSIATYSETYPYEGRLADEYPVTNDGMGTVVSNTEQNFQDDMGHLFGNKSSIRVTRMRADLPQASLAADLALQASQDQALLPVTRNVTREADEPQCRQDAGCSTTGDSSAELAGVLAVVGATVIALRRKKTAGN
ncbi:MAG: DUF2330 domain-containing protein [Polyangiaceae bacterium]|nr:DUF2330 domain-containing protein [Polyangiaceae bacterium]